MIDLISGADDIWLPAIGSNRIYADPDRIDNPSRQMKIVNDFRWRLPAPYKELDYPLD